MNRIRTIVPSASRLSGYEETVQCFVHAPRCEFRIVVGSPSAAAHTPDLLMKPAIHGHVGAAKSSLGIYSRLKINDIGAKALNSDH
jgi:hypothetical protein